MDTDAESKAFRSQIRRCNKEMLALRKKLTQLEKERRLLTQDVEVKEEEKRRSRARQAELARQKIQLLKNLKALDTERTVQSIANVKLSQGLLQVLEDATLRDKRILALERELDETLENMKKQRYT